MPSSWPPHHNISDSSDQDQSDNDSMNAMNSMDEDDDYYDNDYASDSSLVERHDDPTTRDKKFKQRHGFTCQNVPCFELYLNIDDRHAFSPYTWRQLKYQAIYHYTRTDAHLYIAFADFFEYFFKPTEHRDYVREFRQRQRLHKEDWMMMEDEIWRQYCMTGRKGEPNAPPPCFFEFASNFRLEKPITRGSRETFLEPYENRAQEEYAAHQIAHWMEFDEFFARYYSPDTPARIRYLHRALLPTDEPQPAAPLVNLVNLRKLEARFCRKHQGPVPVPLYLDDPVEEEEIPGTPIPQDSENSFEQQPRAITEGTPAVHSGNHEGQKEPAVQQPPRDVNVNINLKFDIPDQWVSSDKGTTMGLKPSLRSRLRFNRRVARAGARKVRFEVPEEPTKSDSWSPEVLLSGVSGVVLGALSMFVGCTLGMRLSRR
ncbi:hypothetical protein FQN57_004449 [Myotisia sp. PD_48]|nr:hypothetical protein FQN57_004449 [Myotisia sp. PD_48]